ncbi:MAG: histidinol-phosphate transaminase [Nitrospinota bacterium]
MDPTRLIKPSVKALEAYEAPVYPCRVKLDAAESPYPPPSRVAEGLAELARSLPVHRYPAADAVELKKALAAWYRTSPERLVVGNGSDELVQLLCTAFGGAGTKVLLPVPTFTMYGIIARTLEMEPVEVPLRDDWSLDGEAMDAALEDEAVRLVFLASPNNPTGNRFAEETIRALVEADRAMVVIDEAYGEFAGGTLAGFVERHPHVVVLRSCSKMGLAGLRLGTLIASPPVVAAVEKARLPYNVNSFTQAAVRLVLEHREALEAQIEAIRTERARLAEALEAQPGVTPCPSEANFLLFRVDGLEAKTVHERLLEAGVGVRYFGGPGRLGRCLRVTVGRPEENEAFLKALAAALQTEG